MCLGMPGRIIDIEGEQATLDCWGVKRATMLTGLGEKVVVGDYVLTHRGEAVRRIPDADIFDTLGLYEILLSEGGEDPIVCDAVYELGETAGEA